MNNQFKSLIFPEIIVFTPRKFEDNRGIFFENFNFIDFKKEKGIFFEIIQENISFSHKNVLRGLHFQKGKMAQSKLLNVIKGSIYDVIVDIRPNSKNFGKWISYKLNDLINESIYIPIGFAHGFLALEEYTKVSYKVDNFYCKSAECSIVWSDKKLNINWLIENPVISNKDKVALSFEENYYKNNFKFQGNFTF